MTDKNKLRELAILFLKLGTTAFGGPVAHIAMMEEEIVVRRKWLDRQHFLDLVGATNLIPGPNSTELAIHIGRERAGWPGLVVAGACFILPAMLIVMALAALYVRYGALPQAQGVLAGVLPVVIAIVAQALWRFMQTALKSAYTVIVAVVAAAMVVAGVNEVVVIAITAVAGVVYSCIAHRYSPRTAPSSSNPAGVHPTEAPQPEKVTPDNNISDSPGKSLPAMALLGGGLTTTPLWPLFLVFLKIGSIVYGSGYVLIAFLRADLVERLGWLTDRQLLDAITVGQVTPGPVFTTATFIGYQLAGVPGALTATLGIFLPSFLFVGLLSTVMDRLRQAPATRGFLDSINAASLALMAVVTVQLAARALTVDNRIDLLWVAVAIASLALLIRTRINSVWLIAAGAVLGTLRTFLG